MIPNQPVALAVRELSQWAIRRRRRLRVTGASMEPTRYDGDYVLVDPTGPVAVGVVVVARPEAVDVDVVKRIGSATDTTFELVSDNPKAGTDSRAWGPVGREAIDGVVTLVLDRPFASLARPTQPPAAATRVASWARWLRR